MAETKNGLEFDPGFAPNILAFRGTVEYLYTDINRFKNFSQRKVKFMQYYKKILDVLYNNIGFYTGCLMWAAYLKAQPQQKILSNPCFGEEYNEEENIADTQYILKFTELFPKDMKYFLGQAFEFDSKIIRLTRVYEEFLKTNRGFTETDLNTDIIIPEGVKSVDSKDVKALIDRAVSEGNLSLLTGNIDIILK